jgi:hypothetical protein
MSATRESRPLPTVPEFLAYLFAPAADSPIRYIGPCDRPAPGITGSPKPIEPENREPVPISEVIRAFLSHPERFIADAFPEPPEAA